MLRNKIIFVTAVFCLVFLGSFSALAQSTRKNVFALEKAIAANNTAQVISETSALEPYFATDPSLGFRVNDRVAFYFKEKGALGQSVFYYKQALRYMTKGNEIDHLFSLGSIAFIYLQLSDTATCKSYLDSCLLFANQVNQDFFKVHSYNNFGLFYSKANQHDSALFYFQQAKNHLNSTHSDSILYGALSGNIARVLTHLGKWQQSIPYYETNLNYSSLLNEREDYCYTIIEYSMALLELGNTNKAQLVLNEVKTDAMERYPQMKGQWLATQSLIAASLNKDSVGYWIESYRKHSSDVIAEQSREVNLVLSEMMDKKMELLLSEQQLKQAEKDRASKKTIIRVQQIALGLLLVLSAAIVGLLLYRRRVVKKEGELQTAQLKNELVNQQLENEALKAAKLELELDHKSRDVTNLAMDIHDKHEMQQEWSARLKKIKNLKDLDTLKEGIGNLLSEVEQSERMDKEKAPLKNKVDEVNSAFYDALNQKFPNLTKNERELCGMIRLNMNTKEIATLKNITPGSAKVMKHRLRKKMGLETGEELYLFVAKV